MEKRDDERGRYNTPEYYQNNRELGENRYPSRNSNTERERAPDNYDDQEYDELNTGKYEHYIGAGYYGSGYGSINNLNSGRDYEQNAGYRYNYDHLTSGQWPEIERAQKSREQAEKNNHRGKGPRTYQRSDLRIHEDANDLLAEDRYIDASDVEVVVQNGEVTLTGTVEDRHAKRRAEYLIENLPGVKHLENRLRVKRNSGPSVNIQNHD